MSSARRVVFSTEPTQPRSTAHSASQPGSSATTTAPRTVSLRSSGPQSGQMRQLSSSSAALEGVQPGQNLRSASGAPGSSGSQYGNSRHLSGSARSPSPRRGAGMPPRHTGRQEVSRSRSAPHDRPERDPSPMRRRALDDSYTRCDNNSTNQFVSSFAQHLT